MFFKSVSFIRLKIQKKTVILWNIITIKNNCFLFEYILKYYLFLWWQSWILAAITPVFSVTWFFRNHSNMLIWSPKNIYFCYQCWKQLCCLILLMNRRFKLTICRLIAIKNRTKHTDFNDNINIIAYYKFGKTMKSCGFFKDLEYKNYNPNNLRSHFLF